MATFTEVGNSSGSGTGSASVTHTNAALGNLLVLVINATIDTLSGVTGGGVAEWTISPELTGNAHWYIAWGVVTSTGSQTTTVTWSNPVALTVDLLEFAASGASSWATDGAPALVTTEIVAGRNPLVGGSPELKPSATDQAPVLYVTAGKVSGFYFSPPATPPNSGTAGFSDITSGTALTNGGISYALAAAPGAYTADSVTFGTGETDQNQPFVDNHGVIHNTPSTPIEQVAWMFYLAGVAPTAPTLLYPSNESPVSGVDELGVDLQATYNESDGSDCSAYALRVKQGSGGAYQYWNATTQTLQATEVWNAVSGTAPGGTLSVSIPAGKLADGYTYYWSMATQESLGDLQGPFASDFDFVAGLTPLGGAVATAQASISALTVVPLIASAEGVYMASASTTAGFAPASVPWLVPCAINDHPYVMNFAKTRITTMPVRRQSADDSVEPGEQTLSAAGVWPRAQDNYFLGAGQEFLDNRFAFESVYVHSGEYPSVRTRFWKSQGVDPWDEGKMSLLAEQHSIATSTTGLLIIACGSYLYKTDGANLYWTENPVGVSSPTWTQVTTANTNVIVDLATDGSRVWFACGNQGVYVTVAGTTSSATASTPAALNGIGGLLAYDAGAGTTVTANLPATGTVNYYVSEVDAFGNETKAANVSHTSTGVPINITWNPDTEASGFKVRRNTGGSDYLIYDGTDPAFVDDGTVVGTVSAHPTSDGTGTTPYPATFVLYAKGHLVGSSGRDLVEILADQSISFIYQHENPSFVWTCGCECPTAILVGGFVGGTSYVGAIQPDAATNGATLAPPTWATTLTPGEQINDIAYDAGAILIASNLGIRSGTKPDSLGTFDVNPVIEDPGSVLCLAPWGQYEYFGWSNYDPTEAWVSRSTVAGLGRADQSQFTTAGVPAYATDVMSSAAGTTTQVLVMSGVPYFVTLDSGTYNLWGPDGKVVASGWFEPGWIRYGTLENKILVEVDFQHEPLPSGASVNYKIVLEDMADVVNVVTNSAAGSTTLEDPFPAGLLVGDRFMPIITLNADTGQDAGPVFHSHITKAMVTTKRQDEILLCIEFFEEARTLQGAQTFYLNILNEWNFLKGLEAAGNTVNLTMGSIVKVAYIDQVLLEPVDMGQYRDWFQGDLTVKLVTLS